MTSGGVHFYIIYYYSDSINIIVASTTIRDIRGINIAPVVRVRRDEVIDGRPYVKGRVDAPNYLAGDWLVYIHIIVHSPTYRWGWMLSKSPPEGSAVIGCSDIIGDVTIILRYYLTLWR